MFAQSLGVLLHLFQDESHSWVMHNLLHLRVNYDPQLHILRAVMSVVL